MRFLPVHLVLGSLLASGTALAQERGVEYRVPDVDRVGDSALSAGGGFDSAWYEYDNIDLRPLDESSDQAILDSDDRNAIAFTSLFMDLAYQVDEDTELVLSASHRGLWGNDQFGGTSSYGGWVWFSAAYVDWKALQDDALSVRMGRQYYQIGGLGGAEDFALSDNIDGVRIDLKLGNVGHLELIPITVVGLSGDNDNANFYSFVSASEDTTFGFRGDHTTRRHGAVLSLDDVAEGLDARAYAFYTDIANLGTGSDISYAGKLGNFSDNDWVMNIGLRGSYEAGVITPFAALDLSTGVDRKELVAQDVTTNGMAIYAGLYLDTAEEEGEPGLMSELSFYQANGAAYDDEGLQYNHGYVGMKGSQAGGMIADRFMGWHPAAYVGAYGVSQSPHDTDRKAGTRVIKANVGYQLPGPLRIDAGWWMFQDTGLTFISDFGAIDNYDPPFGYSTREFAAEERLGKTLGQEVNLHLGVDATEHISFFAAGAAFLPGDFYAIEVDRIAGDQLGGGATAWTGAAGMDVAF